MHCLNENVTLTSNRCGILNTPWVHPLSTYRRAIKPKKFWQTVLQQAAFCITDVLLKCAGVPLDWEEKPPAAVAHWAPGPLFAQPCPAAPVLGIRLGK